MIWSVGQKGGEQLQGDMGGGGGQKGGGQLQGDMGGAGRRVESSYRMIWRGGGRRVEGSYRVI